MTIVLMNNICLYTTFYNEDNNYRKNELLTCLTNNISNTAISKLIVFNEGDIAKEFFGILEQQRAADEPALCCA